MAPARKLTISIPEELARRLEPWRERMNISRVCSEAIAQEIDALEGLSRGRDRVQAETLDMMIGMAQAQAASLAHLASQLGNSTPLERGLATGFREMAGSLLLEAADIVEQSSVYDEMISLADSLGLSEEGKAQIVMAKMIHESKSHREP
jgi:hypothetical protein